MRFVLVCKFVINRFQDGIALIEGTLYQLAGTIRSQPEFFVILKMKHFTLGILGTTTWMSALKDVCQHTYTSTAVAILTLFTGSGRGTCHYGSCICHEGFYGHDCSQASQHRLRSFPKSCCAHSTPAQIAPP